MSLMQVMISSLLPRWEQSAQAAKVLKSKVAYHLVVCKLPSISPAQARMSVRSHPSLGSRGCNLANLTKASMSKQEIKD